MHVTFGDGRHGDLLSPGERKPITVGTPVRPLDGGSPLAALTRPSLCRHRGNAILKRSGHARVNGAFRGEGAGESTMKRWLGVRRSGSRLPVCRLALAGLAAGAGLVVAGCTPTVIPFAAYVDPPRGHVPYEATIVSTELGGTYTFYVNGETFVQQECTLRVTVDDLEWEARVEWTNGRDRAEATAAAQGTNALPRILRPMIDHHPETWVLIPRERTLIDFTHRPSEYPGLETGVVFDGGWRVTEIHVMQALKTLPDSIFCPPYEPGVYHAAYGGELIDNACIVYPLYTSEWSPNGLPYPPSYEEGYPQDPLARQHNLFYGIPFDEGGATISVTVEDEWGRVATASFVIPVRALHHTSAHPIDMRYFVADVDEDVYHHFECPHVAEIPLDRRIYFASTMTARESGRVPCEDCSP